MVLLEINLNMPVLPFIFIYIHVILFYKWHSTFLYLTFSFDKLILMSQHFHHNNFMATKCFIRKVQKLYLTI